MSAKDGYTCQLCLIRCGSQSFYNSHMQGKRHQNKVAEITGEPPGGKETFCNLCRLQCGTALFYQNHLLGGKHQDRLAEQVNNNNNNNNEGDESSPAKMRRTESYMAPVERVPILETDSLLVDLLEKCGTPFSGGAVKTMRNFITHALSEVRREGLPEGEIGNVLAKVRQSAIDVGNRWTTDDDDNFCSGTGASSSLSMSSFESADGTQQEPAP